MKKFICSLIAILFFFGCEFPNPPNKPDNPNDPNKPPVEVDMLDVSLVEIAFTADKDASLIVVKTNNNWTATKTAEWLSLSATSGEKNTAFLIGAVANASFRRKTIVTIKSGDKTKDIKISQASAPKITFTVKDVAFDMVLVEGGEFTMGSREQSCYGFPHNVKLSDFYISETEVTNALWYAVMNKLPYKEHSEMDKPNFPVSETIWNEINTDFLPVLETISGKAFRLPTEAEWEYAAMGGTKSSGFKYAGSDILDDVAWIDKTASGTKNIIKSRLPNELGLYDMSGNVNEWCSDWYNDYYDFEIVNGFLIVPDLQTNPKGPKTGEKKVVRGGNFSDDEYWGISPCHVKYRHSIKPTGYDSNTGNPEEPQTFVSKDTGFRIVLDSN